MPFDPATFLNNYWQKRPVVLKQFFPNFNDFIDEHELAYLAQDSDLDSRAIIQHGDDWHVIQGPFEEFSHVCQHQWTLLVQGVDRVHPDASALMDAFNFIPYWRMDDLMVSYAVPGAGVGPHLDQYDVFLVQGKGSRRWCVGKPGHHKAVYPHPQLSQIEPFDADIDVELQPGDVLYIPPGWPHEGIATSECLTYSVGFRAPDTETLTRSFDALFTDTTFVNNRYTDPDLATQTHPGLVTRDAIVKLKNQLIDALNHPAWECSLLRLASEQNLLVQPPKQLITAEQLQSRLVAGEYFNRLPGCRPLYTENNDHLRIFVDGEYFDVVNDVDVIKHCIDSESISEQDLGACLDPKGFTSFFVDMINKGYWVGESDD
ncbi:cupin domain-containing protein [Alteromonas ponticola]|nr:cupin domain-containing protein [Alteromonas ponticola]